MSEENKKVEIVFAPGCFDSFEGTQEELDEMIAELQRLADSGELLERSTPLDIDEFLDEFTDDDIVELLANLDNERKLQ